MTEEVTYARVMLPDDANPAGNVHGGSILKMIEHAGSIAATRHCNSTSAAPAEDGVAATPAAAGPAAAPATYVALARLERMDFLAPMHIGEVAQLEARVSYASRRSVEVTVTVWAEQPAAAPPANARRLTNRALLWYVAVRPVGTGSSGGGGGGGGGGGVMRAGVEFETVPVPPLLWLAPADAEAGARRHAASKAARAAEAAEASAMAADADGEAADGEGGERAKRARTEGDGGDGGGGAAVAGRRVCDSRATLCQVVLPGDCYVASQRCFGGVIMKLVDNAAGIVATRHCRTNVVTASFDAMDFLAPVANGNLLTIEAVPTFTSSRSLEIGVAVTAESLHTGVRTTTSRCRLTFVSLSPEGRALPVAQLLPRGASEERRFAVGKARYEEGRELRAAAKAKKAAQVAAQMAAAQPGAGTGTKVID